MKNNLLLKFANTFVGREYFGVPAGKEVIKITNGSVHYYTGKLSKKNGLPVICSQGTPGGTVVKKVLHLLEIDTEIIELALMGIKHPFVALMADTGYKSPTGTGDPQNEWNFGSNAYASDDSRADGGKYKGQDYDSFAFGVAGADSIEGILAEIEGFGGQLLQVKLSWDGGSTYVNKDETMPTDIGDEAYITYGGAADDWGHTPWDPDELSDANFRLRLLPLSDGLTARVDHVRVKVYYTGGEAPPTAPTGFMTTNTKYW